MTEQQQKVTYILYFNQLKNDKASGSGNYFTHYYAFYLYLHAQMDCLHNLDLVPTQVTKKSINLASPHFFYCHHLKASHSY